ncbi:hypothetical protein ACIRQP_08695 [Streptomyces sp. NPDC102274]|uniref:hypothetical protein n=1 Tax=Streptomyces sp. NPDC102274 TaxID=3366151 RepID=UPI0037FBC7DD
MRRWIKVSVAAVVVLGVGGYVAAPYVQDWRLARNACGGALPRDAVERLTPADSRLTSEESRQIDGLGSYRCSLTLEGDEVRDKRFVEMAAYTRREDQDREFMGLFPEAGFSAQAPLPDGMPGFIGQYRTIQLLLDCPDLGKDDEGRQRKLLVNTWLGRDVNTGVPGAAYRTAVALTNSASEKLGCGAEPLEAPKRDVALADPEEDPKTVPLLDAKDTACEWVTGAGLSESADWRVAVGANHSAPTGRCDLSSGDEESGEKVSRMVFVSWYGDWSNRLTATNNQYERLSLTATARCDGEAANYALDTSDDIPGVDEAAKQRMLKRFAEDEVSRRGCSGLRFSF